jgi:hypothetical protein
LTPPSDVVSAVVIVAQRMTLVTSERKFDLGVVGGDERIVGELDAKKVVNAAVAKASDLQRWARSVRELFGRLGFAASKCSLVLLQGAPDARLGKAVQDLDDDTAVLLFDGRNRAAMDWRRNLLKAERRHSASPRR